jgi:NagD protein
VVLGETHTYNVALITKAIRLIAEGARFIATNPDPSGPSEDGLVPACGAMAALVETASGVRPFFVGKPNPLMMRSALKKLECRREETVIVGDRMDTDMLAGIESEITTCLVLSGVSTRESAEMFAYRPDYILNGVGEIVPS